MMDYHFHIITPQFYPVLGGAERSVERLAEILMTYTSGSKSTVYVLDSPNFPNPSNRKFNFDVVYLYQEKREILEPLGMSDEFIEFEKVKSRHIFKVDELIISNKISHCIESSNLHKHVIISFYLTNAGFIGQQIANSLKLKHITSLRGSDFSLSYHHPIHNAIYDFVINNVDFLVCTNKEQQNELVRQYNSCKAKIGYIYNSVSIEDEDIWLHPRTTRFRLFSDTGFSYKKGSHILLKAIYELVQAGYDLEFYAAGNIDKYEFEYWSGEIARYQKLFGDRFISLGYITDVKAQFLLSNLYVSATLGEGCSSSRIFAYSYGIPMVTTLVAEFADISDDVVDVTLVRPGCYKALVDGIKKAIENKKNEENSDSTARIRQRRHLFSTTKERKAWFEIIKELHD